LIVGMINPMRKTHFKIFVALITAALFTACRPAAEIGELNSSTPKTSSTAFVPLVSTPQPPENASTLPDTIPTGLEVEFWHPWSGKMANLVNKMIEDFNANNQWGIQVQGNSLADEQVLMQHVSQALESSEPLPDLIAAPDFFLVFLSDSGVTLRDQEELMSSSTWGIPAAILERFFPIFLNSARQGNQQIGFPAYRTGNYIFYNRTWAEELGFSQMPENPEEFETQTCAAARANQFGAVRENIGTGGWVYSSDSSAFYSWLKGFGGGANDPAENVSSLLSIGNIESSTFLYELFLPANNCAWLGRQTLPYHYFANRQAIAYSGILEDILIQEQVNEINGMDDDWTVIPYPSISGKPILIVSGISYGITSDNENKSLAAWEFIKWMTTTENQVKIVETTASFPLSASALERLSDYRIEHPAWSDGMVFLPFAEPFPASNEWIIMRDILSDISWQLIQFTTSKDDVPLLWENAEILLQEFADN